jgi:DNA polymerase sigma
LLISFFQLYGFDFNYAVCGIREAKARYFTKTRRSFAGKPREHFLVCIESPYDRNLDVGSPSYNIMKARAAFEWAYKELTYEDTTTGAPTLLSRILPPESVLYRLSTLPTLDSMPDDVHTYLEDVEEVFNTKRDSKAKKSNKRKRANDDQVLEIPLTRPKKKHLQTTAFKLRAK